MDGYLEAQAFQAVHQLAGYGWPVPLFKVVLTHVHEALHCSNDVVQHDYDAVGRGGACEIRYLQAKTVHHADPVVEVGRHMGDVQYVPIGPAHFAQLLDVVLGHG